MHEVALADPPLRITPVSIVPSRNTLQAQHADRELSLATCNASLLECIQANNQSGVVFFRELGNWLRVLSDQQYLKNIALGECVATGLADSIGIAIAGGYSEELAGLEVKIDRDFVNDERHARVLACDRSGGHPQGTAEGLRSRAPGDLDSQSPLREQVRRRELQPRAALRRTCLP